MRPPVHSALAVREIRRCPEPLPAFEGLRGRALPWLLDSAENLARSVREVLAKHLGDDAVEQARRPLRWYRMGPARRPGRRPRGAARPGAEESP